MIKLVSILFTLFFVTSAAFSGDQHMALTVNFKSIESESLAIKDLLVKIEKSQHEITKEFEVVQNNLRNEAQGLEKQRTIVSADVFEKKQKALESKIIALESEFREKQKKLEEKKLNILEDINGRIKIISKNIANSRGVKIVIPAESAIFVDDSADITPEVIKALNKDIKSVDF